MNAKILVFVIYVEAITYLLSYNLHDCNFNAKVGILELRITKMDKDLSKNKIKEMKKFIMSLEN